MPEFNRLKLRAFIAFSILTKATKASPKGLLVEMWIPFGAISRPEKEKFLLSSFFFGKVRAEKNLWRIVERHLSWRCRTNRVYAQLVLSKFRRFRSARNRFCLDSNKFHRCSIRERRSGLEKKKTFSFGIEQNFSSTNDLRKVFDRTFFPGRNLLSTRIKQNIRSSFPTNCARWEELDEFDSLEENSQRRSAKCSRKILGAAKQTNWNCYFRSSFSFQSEFWISIDLERTVSKDKPSFSNFLLSSPIDQWEEREEFLSTRQCTSTLGQ